MFYSKNLMNEVNIKHCFFSRKNGVSSGIYKSLNCGIGSKDDINNYGLPKPVKTIIENYV